MQINDEISNGLSAVINVIQYETYYAELQLFLQLLSQNQNMSFGEKDAVLV